MAAWPLGQQCKARGQGHCLGAHHARMQRDRTCGIGSSTVNVAHLTALFRRNHERNWPGLSDRAAVNKSTDSGGEGGVLYDKRMGLGMPIVLRAPISFATLRPNRNPNPDTDADPGHCSCKSIYACSIF